MGRAQEQKRNIEITISISVPAPCMVNSADIFFSFLFVLLVQGQGWSGFVNWSSAVFLSCIGVPIRASQTFRETFLQPYLHAVCAREMR